MTYEDLEVLKRSNYLHSSIYEELKDLHNSGFLQLMTRHGLTLTQYILESVERDHQAETMTFLSNAKQTCGDLRTQIYIGTDIGYINKNVGQKWLRETNKISSMLGELIKTKLAYTDNYLQEL